MPSVDVVVESPVSTGFRVRQLEGMFDVPRAETARLEWRGNVPIEDEPWRVGLIVGPSGCGKSTLLRDLFGDPRSLKWGAPSVIEDFDPALSIADIAAACQAVGFNTIPAWMRPFAVLSNGEQFRATLGRLLIEEGEMVVVDEFTSVVDRQVAKIGAHAVQKWIRKHPSKQFVAASCHYDVVDWLQPDWILEPATMTFSRRSLQRRPELEVAISPVPYSAWRTFAPFHYLTKELHRAAQCFCLFVDDRPAAFAGIISSPISSGAHKGEAIRAVSRLVTLPDWQGMGLAMVLVDQLGAAYTALRLRLRTYPAHPALIRTFDRSRAWAMKKRPGTFSQYNPRSSTGSSGGRPCGVFEYVGPAMDRSEAARLIRGGSESVSTPSRRASSPSSRRAGQTTT